MMIARRPATIDQTLLMKNLENLQARRAAKHFLYQENSETCRKHLVIHLSCRKVAFRRARIKIEPQVLKKQKCNGHYSKR